MHASGKIQLWSKENISIQIDVKKLTLDNGYNLVQETENKHKSNTSLQQFYKTRYEDNEATDSVKEIATVNNNIIRRKNENGKSTRLKESFWCSSRFALIVIGFFGFINLYALRVNMSVAIVCMTGRDHNTSNVCSFTDGNASQSNITIECDMPEVIETDDKFDWDKKIQGLILGSFFLGYAITLLPGGWFAGKYGGKHLYGWSMFVCAVATLLTPLAARTSVVLLIAMRIVVGLCQGVVSPCMIVLLSYWIPPLQRSSSVSFVYAGTQIGVMVAFPLSGVLCVDRFNGGWPSIFYVFEQALRLGTNNLTILGCLGLVFVLAWVILVYDSPLSHPRISVKEREFIVDQLKPEINIYKKLSFSTPWSKIFTSLPVWAIIVSKTCAEWGTYTFLTNMPSYIEDVLHFDIKKAGFLASLPYLGFWVVSNVSAHLADFLRKRGYISTTTARKLFNSIGNIIPAILIVITGSVAEDPGLAMAMLTLGVAMSGCQFGSGFIVNPVDIAPRYAGIILGISNTISSLAGFFAPMAIGIITVDKTKEQWKTVFYIAAAFYIFGAIFYIVFASGELQLWARDTEDSLEIYVEDKKGKFEVKNLDEEITHL